jgi:hypothetical protein
MTKPMVRIHNTETNEIVDREMTDDEFAAYEEQKAIDSALEIERIAKENDKAALLTKLGITAEEAKLLLS